MKRFTVFLVVVLFWAWAGLAQAADWAFWRGPEQIGVSRETNLPDTFTLKPGDPNLVFNVPYGSLATPLVLNGQVYMLSRVGEKETQQERVLSFDANTGKLLWEHRFNVWHTDIVDDRLAFTNMVGDKETGYVYAHATAGQLFCFDRTGKIIWQRSMTEEFGRVTGYGGRVTSPIIDEDKLILGFPNASWGEQSIGSTRFVAFDKKTGKVIWWGNGNHQVKDTYYSTPVVAVINGQRLLLSGGGDGCIHAFKVRTGERVWSYKFEDGGGAVNCSPVVQGNKIWIGHGEENSDNSQGRIVCLDGGTLEDGKPKLLWHKEGIKVKFAAPVLHDGLLYVCDDAGKIYCLEADSGNLLWDFAYGRNTKGSPLWADGKIYISEVDSHFVILKPSREGCERIARVRFRGSSGVPVELHGSPAVADGKVYFTTTENLVCIGKKDGKSSSTPIAPQPPEPPAGKEVAFVQVVPGDVSLKPGETVEFTAIGYDADGRRIGEIEVTWEKAGMLPPQFPIGAKAPPPTKGPTPPPIVGELAGSGSKAKFTVAKMPNGQFGRIVAKMGKLSGYARVRVAPVVAYTQDFDKVPEGRTPAGWVNTMGKFAVATLPDGTKVLRKRNDNPSPLIARANAYITDPDASDYTIEADVYGTKVRDKDMPDMGVGACRYSLLLIGNEHLLRLVTWDAQKRLVKEMPFDWKPNTWYRLKLTATVKDGKGVVQGKVWPRGEKEPEAWSLELEDPIPNTEGAALIYGFANGTIDAKNPGAEIYYDNIKITPNSKK